MRGAICIFISSVAAPEALAGPWGQNDGNIFARAAVSSETIDGAQAWRADLYGEYGLSDHWTVIGKSESVRFPDAADFNASETRLVVQRRVYQGRRLNAAIGGGLVYGAAIGGIVGCDDLGTEARASIGTGGIIAARDWYASADISGRWHEDGCTREKLDIVTGIEWRENTTFSPQIYIENSNRGADSVAVQLEWIEHFETFDLTFGYKYETGELFDQQATLVAISKRF